MGKVKSRYAMGWSDPRMPKFDIYPRIITGTNIKTAFKETPTDTLRNLWMVHWGQRGVSVEVVKRLEEGDEGIVGVMQELANRKHVEFQTIEHPESFERVSYYVLEREDADR